MNNQKSIQAYKDEKNLKVKERLFLIKQVYYYLTNRLHPMSQSLGRVRSWAYKWPDRFAEYGIKGMQDMSRTGRPPMIPKKKTTRN